MWEMETGNTNPGPPSGQDQDITAVINWRKNGGIPIIKEDGILVHIIKQCLQYDPQRRPSAVQCVEFLSQLQQHIPSYKN
jgi:serine/threonine protein kinase